MNSAAWSLGMFRKYRDVWYIKYAWLCFWNSIRIDIDRIVFEAGLIFGGKLAILKGNLRKLVGR